MNVERVQLSGTIEILSAILGPSIDDLLVFKNNPQSYIFSHLDYDASAMEIAVVENSAKVMHLALPYYEDIENFRGSNLPDTDMEDISGGGEIIIAIIITAVLGTTALGSLIGAGAKAGDALRESRGK